MSKLIDGQIRFGYSLKEHYTSGSVWSLAATQSGVKTIDISKFALEPPALCFISHGKLLAQCPICSGAEYVWRSGPYIMVCANCGNTDIDNMARVALLPDNLDAIEVILMSRPNPENRNWFPHENIEELMVENETNL